MKPTFSKKQLERTVLGHTSRKRVVKPRLSDLVKAAHNAGAKVTVSLMPNNPADWSAYRCQLSCKIGRDALEGKTKLPAGCSPMEYAMFNLLHAVEELSKE